MEGKIKKRSWFLSQPFLRFFQTESAGGVILILFTGLALFFANSPLGISYFQFWHHSFLVPLLQKRITLHAFINEGLMTLFFLSVGLEIKREVLFGELASLQKAALPFFAALGGMVIPASIYLLFTLKTSFTSGFGIPMATDIAFSLGILSLLGKRVPGWVKIYLTSLAIIDDIFGVLVIALFYTRSLSFWFLGGAGLLILSLAYLSGKKVRSFSLFFLLGILLWICFLFSGVHATLAGILLAFFLPSWKKQPASLQKEIILEQNQGVTIEQSYQNQKEQEKTQEDETKNQFHFEHGLHQVVSYLILPLFALCNAAIPFPKKHLDKTLSHPVFWAITLGLFLGKPLGIFLFSYGSNKLKLSEFPKQAHWKSTLAVSSLAGIGFTMSLFITELSFVDLSLQEIAKLAILFGSVLSALTGSLLFCIGFSLKTAAPRETKLSNPSCSIPRIQPEVSEEPIL